jgi:hypothetical protein
MTPAPQRSTVTADEFRELTLAVPGATEQSHMNHPDFRLKGKIFASLGAPDEQWGMVKLTPQQQENFVKRAPKMFKPCNGAWGRQGYTNVHLASANRSVLTLALASAAENVAAGKSKRKKT